MIYNDHGIMPSEIMQALSNAYKQNEQNSRQKTKELVESFFCMVNEAKQSLCTLSDMGKEIRLEITSLIKTLDSWQYNIASLYDVKVDTKAVESRANLFFGMSRFGQCIDILIQLAREGKNTKQLMTYISQGNAHLLKLNDCLAKKSIAIRRYI